MLSGFFLVVKPVGLTSTQLGGRFKRLLRPHWGKVKLGHMGTLDPFATGLLPLAVGQGTRLIPWMEKRSKSYRFFLKWGEKTTTGDLTGEVIETSSRRPLISEIEEILPQFQGEIFQIPPRFSALKVEGKRAYDLARRGVDFALKPRPQFIESLTLQESSDEGALFEVACNTGTSIRTLAEDIAEALGVFGHLTALTRSRVGSWSLEAATPLDSFLKIAHDEGALRKLLLRPCDVLDDIPAVEVTEEEEGRLRQGLFLHEKTDLEGVVACKARGLLIALARAQERSLYPFRVFNFDN